jgi:hypothetical protein
MALRVYLHGARETFKSFSWVSICADMALCSNVTSSRAMFGQPVNGREDIHGDVLGNGADVGFGFFREKVIIGPKHKERRQESRRISTTLQENTALIGMHSVISLKKKKPSREEAVRPNTVTENWRSWWRDTKPQEGNECPTARNDLGFGSVDCLKERTETFGSHCLKLKRKSGAASSCLN